MLKDIPITEARHELTSLPERLAKEPGAIPVTRRGKPVLAILPWEFYESLMETLEIIGDESFMKTLRQGIKEAGEGRGIPWEKAKKQLGL
jgi:prevent-host-death family protein